MWTSKLQQVASKYYMMIWYDMIWYDMIWYDMIWYDMIWYDECKSFELGSRVAFSFCTLMKSIDCYRECSNRLSSKCHLRICVDLAGLDFFQFISFIFMSLALRLHRLPLTQAQYATACRLVLGSEYALQAGVAKAVSSILNHWSISRDGTWSN